MFDYLVPSSPLAFDKTNHTPSNPNETIPGASKQYMSLATQPSKNDHINIKYPKTRLQFPTPNPSSSIGDIPSSPITPLNDQTNTANQSPRRQTSNHHLQTTSNPIELRFSTQHTSTVTLGRNSKLCDVLLPARRGISRQHVRITYFNQSNKVKIECIGSNSIVVNIPYDDGFNSGSGSLGSHYYINQVNVNNCKGNGTPLVQYELLLPSELTNFESAGGTTSEVFIKYGSFSLKNGESCILTLFENVSISIKDTVEIKLLTSVFDADLGVVRKPVEVTTMPTSVDRFVTLGSTSCSETCGQDGFTTPRRTLNDNTDTVDEAQLNGNLANSEQLVLARVPQTPFISEVPSSPRTPVKLKRNYSFKEDSPLKRRSKLRRSTGKKVAGFRSSVTSSPVFNSFKEQSPSPLSPLSSPLRSIRKERTHSEKTKGFYNLSLLPPVKIHAKKKLAASNTHKEVASEPAPVANKFTDPDPDPDPLQAMAARGINCEEIQHVLSNYLAFASVQQVPFSYLRGCSGVISTLSSKELRALLKAERSIGVIERHGKDAAGNPLEEEYYYDLENDEDKDRQKLVFSIKGGRVGLRACRRTHKQYFWKKPEHKIRKRE